MIRRAIRFAVVGAVVSIAKVAGADGPVCIPDAAKPSAVACANANVVATAHPPGTAPRAIPVRAAPAPRPTTPPPPSADPGLGPRKAARARALLVTEIRGLESLFDVTPRSAPDRAQLARRIADDYVELEGAATAEKVTAEIARDAAKRSTPPNPGLAQQRQNDANSFAAIASAARKKAIDFYTLVATDHPNSPSLDQVLYYLAYEYEQANDTARARKAYFDLLQKVPGSPYVPAAYLAFAEQFFLEAQGDPSKWELAIQAYKEVIKYPPQTNAHYGYAWYKLAYAFWNKGALDRALDAFKKTIDFGVAYAQHPGASKLADTARRDLIPLYALKGDPGAAYDTFHGLGGDPPGTISRTVAMMDELGVAYLDTGHYPEAILVYRDLSTRDKGSARSCHYQSQISEATLASRAGNKEAIKLALDEQLKVYKDFKGSGHTDADVNACASQTASLVLETAITWHIEATGSGQQRGTNDPKTMSLASYFYRRALDTWSFAEMAKLEFPHVVREDWPTRAKIQRGLADLAWVQEKWAECGPAFDAIVAETPNGPDAADAAYSAVLCYQKLYEAQHPAQSERRGRPANAPPDWSPKTLGEQQRGMIGAFDRYVCAIHPGANDAAGREQLAEVKWARARTYFEAQHWEEAGAAFREIAFTFPERDGSVDAAELYLESINVLATHSTPARPSCIDDDMKRDVPQLVALYCTGDKEKANADECKRLHRVQVDLLRSVVQTCVSEADRTGAVSRYAECGAQYLELYRTYCKAPVDAGQPPRAEKCDEIVYNAARSFQAGRLIAKAIAARMLLIDPANHLDRSPLAKQAVYEIGGNYQAIAVYDQAADWYEKYAQAGPAPNVDKALSDAVVLRLGLGTDGDVKRAIDDASLFQRLFGNTKGSQSAAIAFAIAAHWAEKEDWEHARASLQSSIALVDRAAGLDVQVQAHAILARSAAHLADEGGARSEYARVRELWKDPGAGKKRIDSAYPNEDESRRTKRLAKVLDAVGEALFYAADQAKRATVDPITFPMYTGPGTTTDVQHHIDTKVSAWMTRKMSAIGAAELEYKKIVDLQPEAPPRWIIAAGARVGLMWGAFVDDFRKAPYPKAWDQPGCAMLCGTANQLTWRELRERYLVGLRLKSEPIKTQRAKPALVTCLTYSVKFQYFDDSSRACEVWLAANYKSEYHVVDELRGAPTLGTYNPLQGSTPAVRP